MCIVEMWGVIGKGGIVEMCGVIGEGGIVDMCGVIEGEALWRCGV